MENKVAKSIKNGIFIVLIVALGFVFIYINLAKYKIGLNADVAAEGLLAREIWESKQWIPKDWYFSTESKVIGVTNLASLFYGMTGSMCLAMGLGCIAGIVFIVGSLLYLGKKLEFDSTQNLLLLFLVLLLPNNKNQIELLYLFAGYYAFHVGLYFLTLSCYLKMVNKKEKNAWLAVVLGVLHFVLGAQGVRGILMITGPLMAVEMLRRIYRWNCDGTWHKEDNRISLFVILLNVVGFLGSRIPISVGYPLSRNIRKAPQKLFEIVLPDFFQTFAWDSITGVEKLAFAFYLIVVIALTMYIIGKGIKKQNIRGDEWVLLNFVMSVFLTIAALTFTTVDSSSRYFMIIFFAMAIGIVVLWKKSNKILRTIVVLSLIVVVLGNSVRVYYPMTMKDNVQHSEYAQISDYLAKEGYENAYTIFEHANTITVMGDGKVQVSAVASMSNMEVCKWLSSRKWYVPNVPKEAKTAYIVSDYGLEEFNSFLQEHQDTIELKNKIGGFHIYGSDYNYSRLTD